MLFQSCWHATSPVVVDIEPSAKLACFRSWTFSSCLHGFHSVMRKRQQHTTLTDDHGHPPSPPRPFLTAMITIFFPELSRVLFSDQPSRLSLHHRLWLHMRHFTPPWIPSGPRTQRRRACAWLVPASQCDCALDNMIEKMMQ